MPLLYALELLFIAIFMVVVSTQLVVPLIKGTKTFPAFRRRKLTAAIVRTQEEIEQAKITALLNELEASLRKHNAQHAAPEAPKE